MTYQAMIPANQMHVATVCVIVETSQKSAELVLELPDAILTEFELQWKNNQN